MIECCQYCKSKNLRTYIDSNYVCFICCDCWNFHREMNQKNNNVQQIKIDSKINWKICFEKIQEYIQEEHKMYDSITSITVSCRGFTGTLVKLEEVAFDAKMSYTLSIREIEKGVIHTWESVRPNEIKLVSGMVTMGG